MSISASMEDYKACNNHDATFAAEGHGSDDNGHDTKMIRYQNVGKGKKNIGVE